MDIRKAVAEPPQALRPHLKRIVGDLTMRSRKVYQHKGTPEPDERVPFWRRYDLRDSGAAWRVNRDHPLVRLMLTTSPEIASTEILLRSSMPFLPSMASIATSIRSCGEIRIRTPTPTTRG